MKNRFFFLFVFSNLISAQNFDSKYYQFEASIPFKANDKRGEYYEDGTKNNSFFIPDGLSAKAGLGVHYEQWASVGLHSGVDWKATQQVVAIPLFVNFKLSPEISENGDILFFQYGIGKAIGIGKNDFFGGYQRFNLGVQTEESGFGLFLDYSIYNISLNNKNKVSSLSIGVIYTCF